MSAPPRTCTPPRWGAPGGRAARLTLALLAGTVVALAASAEARAEEPRELRLRPAPTIAVLSGTGLLLAVGLAVDAPDACRWCDSNGFDRGIRHMLVADDTEPSRHGSDVLLTWVLPALALGSFAAGGAYAGETSVGLQDAALGLESVLLASGLTAVVKDAAGRLRPYAWAQDGNRGGVEDVDSNSSFFSGHTSLTFAMAAGISTIAILRDYPWAPWLTIGSGTLALATGILRISADRHWASDVLVGMAVGTAVGVGVPLLAASREEAR